MSRKRVGMLDLTRGLAMVLVVMYHLLFDLQSVAGVDLPYWLTPDKQPVETVHLVMLWMLFAVSGACSGYSRNLLKRGVLLYLAGFAITVVTTLFIPSFRIVFGVLSCFGACMVFTALAAPVLDRIPWWLLTALGILLWCVFRTFYLDHTIRLWFASYTVTLPDVQYLYPLGLIGSGFSSADYFPVIPYLFMFWAGRGLYRPITNGKMPVWFYRSNAPVLEWIGRHSLLIYAVHQPIILGVVLLMQKWI